MTTRLRSKSLGFTALITTLLLLCLPGQAESVYSAHVEAELVAAVQGIQPGEPFELGIRMKMDPEWHTYWINPGGEAGLPTVIEWDLPEGFTAAPIQWPAPTRFVTTFGFGSESIINYGYSGEILLISTITPPAELPSGEDRTFTANARWLACKTACLPGRATLKLVLPIVDKAADSSSHAERFQQAREQQPVIDHGWGLAATLEGRNIVLTMQTPADYDHDLGQVYLVPETRNIVNEKVTHELTRDGQNWTLRAPLMPEADAPDQLSGILLAENGWGQPPADALSIQLAMVDSPAATAEAATTSEGGDGRTSTVATAPPDEGGLLLALLFAFAGGIILNLMPCVLPVLSLKVLDFVKQANSEHAKAWHHGLVFTLGVLVSFWILAGVLIALRAGGQALGWGFHLQSPGFLLALIALLFVFGLSMFGVFEIGMSLTGVGSEASGRAGFSGSFFSGVLATIVATPCTAPFMASALGYALAQPAIISLLIFTTLGLGMALPYLLLASFPPLLKFVPRPGTWMETFKQFLGFLLMATVVWLLWVLGNQVGNHALSAVLMVLVVLGLASWTYGRWGAPHRSKRARVVGRAVAALLVLVGLYAGFQSIHLLRVSPTRGGAKQVADGKIAWETFDKAQIATYRQAGRPVFVDFTADWCLTCKVNENIAFKDKVAAAIEAQDIVPMKADWTLRDDYITEALAEHGRSGVPLYVLYPADPDREPIILPQVLTQDIVLAAFAKL